MLLTIFAAFLAMAAADLPQTGPVPQTAPRTDAAPVSPPQQPDRSEDEAPPPDPAPPAPDEEALAECERSLEALGAEFERRPAIDGPGRCGLSATYAVTKIARGVSVSPETELTCETALAAARWIRQVVVPAARVTALNASLAETVGVVTQWGLEASTLYRPAEPPQADQAVRD